MKKIGLLARFVCAVVALAGAAPSTAANKLKSNPDRDAYFGETHIHTSWSVDAGARRCGEGARVLTGQPIDSPLAHGDPTLLQEYYGDRPSDQLVTDFGPVFAQALFKVQPGAWQGPIESGFGWHLVHVDTIAARRVPAFEEIEPDVKTAWLGEQKALAWRKAYDAMRGQYTVLLPKPPAQ